MQCPSESLTAASALAECAHPRPSHTHPAGSASSQTRVSSGASKQEFSPLGNRQTVEARSVLQDSWQHRSQPQEAPIPGLYSRTLLALWTTALVFTTL